VTRSRGTLGTLIERYGAPLSWGHYGTEPRREPHKASPATDQSMSASIHLQRREPLKACATARALQGHATSRAYTLV
jgi:hypothetical protein